MQSWTTRLKLPIKPLWVAILLHNLSTKVAPYSIQMPQRSRQCSWNCSWESKSLEETILKHKWSRPRCSGPTSTWKTTSSFKNFSRRMITSSYWAAKWPSLKSSSSNPSSRLAMPWTKSTNLKWIKSTSMAMESASTPTLVEWHQKTRSPRVFSIENQVAVSLGLGMKEVLLRKLTKTSKKKSISQCAMRLQVTKVMQDSTLLEAWIKRTLTGALSIQIKVAAPNSKCQIFSNQKRLNRIPRIDQKGEMRTDGIYSMAKPTIAKKDIDISNILKIGWNEWINNLLMN